MAETTTKSILQILCTTGAKLKDLAIKNGQLIFIRDTQKIALDFGGTRTFFNQIIELANEEERIALSSPVNGNYYFVVGTAILWTYQNKWIQLTSQPNDIVFIGAEIPELGSEKQLYIDTQKKEISVWNEDTKSYLVVANHTEINEVTESDIDSFFN